MHALIRTEGHQTMHMYGKIKNQLLVILVDSGSTNNFLDQSTAKRVKCATQSIRGLKVTVANGEVLETQEVCKEVQWEVQGLKQRSDFFVLPLQGCDLVLGIQWLRTLGPIVWDFSALTMQFVIEGEQITLQGLKAGAIHLASKKTTF